MSTARYVYAVTRRDGKTLFELPIEGLGGAPVEQLGHGDVAAIVSAYEGNGRVRSSRANLSAHEHVVEAARLAGLGTVLPMRFGVVMPTASAVVDDYLTPNRRRLSHLLAELAGKVEYRLKATYLPDVALREAVSSNRRIHRLQAAIRGRPENVTFQARIELGELVAAALDQIKARDAQAMLNRVVRHCDSSDQLPSRGEDIALWVALLVDEGKADDFQRDVDDMGDELRERVALGLVGPLAPWDFVDMQPVG